MSLPSDASTQPFSDTPELQRRLERAAAAADADADTDILHTDDAGIPRPVISGFVPRSMDRTTPPASVAELSGALRKASLASPPDARLILAHYHQLQPTDRDPAAISLPHTIVGRRDLVGVVQRTQDVCFTFSIPFHDHPDQLPPLTCHIYYDPASDDCVIVNKSKAGVFLTGICPNHNRTPLPVNQALVVQPGTWRISVAHGGDPAEQALVDFLILRRQFTFTIREALAPLASSRKRSAADDQNVQLKKRRRDGDLTEVLLAARGSTRLDDAAGADAEADVGPITRTSDRHIVRTEGTSLLDLVDGEVAVVRGRREGHADGDTDLSAAMLIDAPAACGTSATYELHRLKKIAETPSASLFTGQHSRLAGDVVAKVIRYTAKSAVDLVKCAMVWQQEKRMLEKLHHENIISLKAFDGRLFAMYVEPLPASLSRGDESPFAPKDARAILGDVASALAYLDSCSIVHNDIKPANIAYSPERGAVLLDFGLATTSDAPPTLAGTPWYIAPDLITRRSRGSPADVWAMGVTMLYVCGKLRKPEKIMRGWLIRDIITASSDARQKMMQWLDVVNQAKESLTSSDTVEGFVRKMLHPEAKSRIDAAQIVATLGGARR
ncbi:serine/threonine protein kinase [Colletotrichum plurivorum]|uniref:Serine/threonine protein kinase n=1 Tax=Colletotrichum plurivorum TaxID=2175906 RepID=A0A8H6JLN2_9PEZI|nr:serine/threonine protein kinase [Colletotrichum plurivorum]